MSEPKPKSIGTRGRTLVSKVDEFFKITSRGSTLGTELLAGLSTFLALVYIVVVNPAILAQAGINWDAAFFATVLVSGIATLLMGVWARLPFVLAPGMEMNAYIAYFVVGTLGYSWSQALGAVFWSGIVFLVVSISGVRERVLHSIPEKMKTALALSVGVFIALVALKICGLIRYEGLVIAGLGDFFTFQATALYVSLPTVLLLYWKKVPGSVLFSIVVTTLILLAIGFAPAEAIAGRSFDNSLAALAQLDAMVIFKPEVWSVILVLFLIDFYGSVAKLIGLAANTSLNTASGLPGLKEALLIDSSATTCGSILGTSNITVYVESGVGIAAGGRTGLTAIVCGIGLLCCFALAPFVQHIPVVATSGALIFVAITLCPSADDIRRMDWFELLTLAAMLLTVISTSAIDRGLLIGAAAYVLRSLVRREAPNPYLLGSVTILSVGYFIQ